MNQLWLLCRLHRGVAGKSTSIIKKQNQKEVNERKASQRKSRSQAVMAHVCVSALGGEEVDAEEAAGFATAPGLQFRGPPQLLRYALGAVYEDEDPRGELTLVQRVGEWTSVALALAANWGE